MKKEKEDRNKSFDANGKLFSVEMLFKKINSSGIDSYEDKEVEIYIDSNYLQYLIQQLSLLKEEGDHLHFFSKNWGGDVISNFQYNSSSVLADHLRITLVENEPTEKPWSK